MLTQIALGTGVMLVSILIGAASALILEGAFVRYHGWLIRPPHRPKMLLLVMLSSIWAVMTITAGVWVWALAYHLLGVFPTFEESLYFSIVSYTTLGYGDVILPQDWRILSGMTSTNGFLNFGLITALLIEALRQVRIGQVTARRP
ncbi:MAG: metal transporter [Bradyrhizobium sp. PARBB1]|nr:MAG: metal transporter [Bradyrhizobium sp. PARBB1]